MAEPEIGSREWWLVAGLFALRGPVDTILRLLEQQEITRTKARELLFYTARVTGGHWMKPAPEEALPDAPWAKLNWSGDALPDSRAVDKLHRIREAMLRLVSLTRASSMAAVRDLMWPLAERVLEEINKED